jgi:hypothetical protein
LNVVFQYLLIDGLAHYMTNVLELVPLEHLLKVILTDLVLLACNAQLAHYLQQLNIATVTFLTTTLNGFSVGM